MQRIIAFPSEIGWIAFCHEGHLVLRTCFGQPSQAAVLHAMDTVGGQQVQPEDSWEIELVDRFQRFAAGESVSFADINIDEKWMSKFQQRVIRNCRKVKYGETIEYGQLARKSGSPNAARAVGTVMANNRFPLVVPCHRVVASGGAIGGFSAPDGISMKKRLLAIEHHQHDMSLFDNQETKIEV